MFRVERAFRYLKAVDVERAFRYLKAVDLDIRPLRHWTAPLVRSHVFLCILAYHVEWHLRGALAPPPLHRIALVAVTTERSSPAASTAPSEVAKAKKKATKRSADGQRIMNFAGLLAHLDIVTCSIMRLLRTTHQFALQTKPTPLQQTAFRLLNLEPIRVQ